MIARKEDLHKAEDKNRRLNALIADVLKDLREQTAPLKRQREEYETDVEELLSKKFREEKETRQTTKRNRDFYKKFDDPLNPDNARLHSQVIRQKT